MAGSPGIKKYYIGFSVLAVVVLGSLIYTVSLAGAAKTDSATNKAVEKISTKLDTYISSNGVPASLDAADLSGMPDTIKYTKISDSQFKICINYKSAAGGFDASWASLLGGAFGAGQAGYQPDNNSEFFSGSVEFFHKKGDNCQTIKPYTLGGSSVNNSLNSLPTVGRGVYVYCSNSSETYQGRRTAKIQSVDTVNHKITLDSSYIQNFEDSSGFVTSPPKILTITYNSNTSFYDGSCQKITDSALTAGEIADFYVSSAQDTFAGRVEVTP